MLKDAAWYDRVLPDCWGIEPLENSPALPVYEAAAVLIDKTKPVPERVTTHD